MVACSLQGFPRGSAGKESACDAGDLGSIPGLGRSPGEGIGYPIQYSEASLAAQMVKNLPAVQETWVQSLGWEDPLEKAMATHSSCLENSMDRGAWQTAIHGVTKSQIRLSDFHIHVHMLIIRFCPVHLTTILFIVL